MCAMLLESLQSCFPGVPCLVMDFGLSDSRRKYFEEKKLLFTSCRSEQDRSSV